MSYILHFYLSVSELLMYVGLLYILILLHLAFLILLIYLVLIELLYQLKETRRVEENLFLFIWNVSCSFLKPLPLMSDIIVTEFTIKSKNNLLFKLFFYKERKMINNYVVFKSIWGSIFIKGAKGILIFFLKSKSNQCE